MQPIDWAIATIPVVLCLAIGAYARGRVRSVADFMAGGRNAGRFLLCTARSESSSGAAYYVAVFQIIMVSGFSLEWWGQLQVPLGLIVAITGFVIYRYRQTRAMTLAQFFEMRYSRTFRLYMGGLAFFSGLLNFGIIPVTGARFIVHFLELPLTFQILSLTIPTHLAMMAFLMSLCVLIVTMGGQITVLLTDCAEGIVSQLFYVLITVVVLFYLLHWDQTRAMLLSHEAGKSLVNPFDAGKVQDFNLWYQLMTMFAAIYGTMAWQKGHAFNSSAATPHESRMGSVLGQWRGFAGWTMVILLVICALTFLNNPQNAAVVNEGLAKIPNEATRNQMRIPITLAHMLPWGLRGALVAICLMGILAGDGIHMHSWGSVFIQDVVLPLRKNPLSTRQHLWVLRLSIIGVALFAFFFGAFFPQTEYLVLWFSLTGAIYLAGAGAAIIGGLYWSRGTATGAWTAVISGSILAVVGILLRQPFVVGLAQWYGLPSSIVSHLGPNFPLNGQEISFYTSLAALLVYIVVSLTTCRVPHNMDKLLHRGAYKVEADADVDDGTKLKKVNWYYRLLGIDEQFTRMDRIITVGISVWSLFWFGIFLVGSLVYFVLYEMGKLTDADGKLYPEVNAVWAQYWLITKIWLPLAIGILTTVWFTYGGLRDMRIFFRRLRAEKIDARDDGTVRQDGPPPLPAATEKAD